MRAARGFDVLREVAAAPLPGRPSAARERLRQQALDLVHRERLIDAAYSYAIVPLQAPAASVLRAGGESLFAPWLLPASGELTAIACGACTLGPDLERRAGELFAERRPSLATALDELGNALLFAVSRRAQDRMLADANRRGLCMAGELRPGDPGLALDAQSAVLRLAQADAIGISLGAGGLMHPVKSCSMVLGVGVDLPAVEWSRCDHCPTRKKCKIVERAGAAAH
ncbi:MAG TPA: hypothetical protein VMV87_01890 [Burkholderiales bacterium]|nr:hypothetical protein [Burkholderiales bacterium]